MTAFPRFLLSCLSARLAAVFLLLLSLSSLRAQQTWWLATSPSGERLVGVAHDGTMFGAVAANNVNGAALASTDGINWIEHRINIGGGDYQDIAHGNGIWVIVGRRAAGPVILSSPDLITWTDSTPVSPQTPISGDLFGVAWLGNQFVAVGGTGGAATVATSADGITWSGNNPLTAVVLKGVATNGSRIVAVGTSGLVLHSDNGGADWLPQSSITSGTLEDVTYGNGLFVAVGENGQVRISSDGTTWMTETSGIADTLFTVEAIASPSAHFVAAGTNGRLIESTDAMAWTMRTTPTAQILYGLTYGNIGGGQGRFVSVGSIGQIIHSEPLGGTTPNLIIRGQIVSPPTLWPAAQTSGSLQIAITNGPGNWNLTSNVPWITFPSGSNGNASATVSFTVAANSGPASRQGTITLTSVSGTQTFPIQQTASAPTAPQIFPFSSSISGTTITANWNPVSGATSYRVERSVNGPGGPWQTVATLPASQPDYTENGLSPATVYYYRVFAANAIGESPASTIWGGETGPAAVTDLTANSLNHFEIELTWTEAAGADQYILRRRASGAASWDWEFIFAASTSTGSYLDSSLLPDTAYEYELTSLNATFLESNPSNVASARTGISNATFYFNDPQEHVSLLDRRGWHEVFDNGSTAIAVGEFGLIAWNTGGDTWSQVESGTRLPLGRIVFGNTTWLAGGLHPDLLRSTDDGLTWQMVANVAPANGFSSLIFAEGQFVGLHSDGSLQISTDGLAWTTLSISAPINSPSGLAEFFNFDPARNLYAVSRTDGAVFTSPSLNGTWTERSPAQAIGFGSNIRGYAVSSAGHLLVRATSGWAFSSDGINWTESIFVADPVLFGIGHFNGLFYGLTFDNTVRTTSDGVTWSAPQALPFNQTYGLFGVMGNWWAHGISATGNQGNLARGSDLNALTVVSIPGDEFDQNLNAIAFDGGDKLVAVGNAGQIIFGSISTDLWTSIPLGTRSPLALHDVIWDATRWIAVGAERSILSSPDGTNWSVEAHLDAGEPDPGEFAFSSILAVNGGHLASTGERIYFSSDLQNWNQVDFDSAANWRDLIAFNGYHVAIGSLDSSKAARYSPDGVSWTNAPPNRALFSTRYLNGAEAGSFGGQHLLLTESNEAHLFVSRTGTAFTRLPDPVTPIPELSYSTAGFLGFGYELSASLAGVVWQDAPVDLLFNGYGERYWDGVAVGDRHYLVGNKGMIHSIELSQSPPAPQSGILSFNTTSQDITEGPSDQLHSLELVRSGGTAGIASVTIQAIAGGTATPGADFETISQTVTWADGQGGVRTINLNLLTDGLAEGNETILLELSAPGGAPLGTTTQLTINVADQALQAWRASHFANPSLSSTLPTSDFDNDGILNYIEFLLGLDPTVNDSLSYHQQLTPTLAPGSNQLALTLTVAVDPRISVTAEVSSNLQAVDWSSNGARTTTGLISGGQRKITFTDLNPLGASSRFLRLIFDYQP